MFFFTTAQTWLLAATADRVCVLDQLHWPGFLGNWSFLTYGRLWPAYTNILVYGWGLAAGIGSRILDHGRGCAGWCCGRPWIPIISGIFWNIGVTVGVIAVLAGICSRMSCWSFRGRRRCCCLSAYALIGCGGWSCSRTGGLGILYFAVVLRGAFFWFPWLVRLAEPDGGEPSCAWGS